MSDIIDVRSGVPAPIADDDILSIAEMAEKRVAAIIKIKQVALSVTNAHDWTDQQDRPYLQASGSEKVANLFDISWGFATPEPIFEEESDGHYTYTFRGWFRMGTRTIEVEGSRSSKDPFFTQNRYEGEGANKKKIELSVRERNNKRDVRMAAYTNFLGNGISRILGIRNLTWDDLEAYAKVKKADVRGIQYKKAGESPGGVGRPPQSKSGVENGSTPPGGTKTAAELRASMWTMLLEMEGNEVDASEKLKELSGFQGKDGYVAGKSSVNDLSEKAVPVTYGKVKKAHDEWQATQGEANGTTV